MKKLLFLLLLVAQPSFAGLNPVSVGAVTGSNSDITALTGVTGGITSTKTALTTTPTAAITLQNTTAGTGGAADQYSPTAQWTGHLFYSAADHTADFRAYLKTVSGSSNFQLNLESRVDAGSWGNIFSFTSAGGLTTTGVTMAGVLTTTPQALSGAGAVNVTTSATAFTSTGGSQALTLADGVAGQIKTIAHVVDGGSGVLTPTTKAGYSTITFTNAGDSVTLQFFTTAFWCIIGSFGVTIA